MYLEMTDCHLVQTVPGPPGKGQDLSWIEEVNQRLRALPEKRTIHAKVVLLGEMSVGKTSLALRFLDNSFSERYVPTIPVDFRRKDFYFASVEGRKLSFKLWDTAGQERFRSLVTDWYCPGAHAAIIGFSADQPHSLEGTRFWFDILRELAPACLLFLVCCKADAGAVNLDEGQQEQVDAIVREYNAEYWVTSARTGHNVDALFDRMAACLFLSGLRRVEIPQEDEEPPLQLSPVERPVELRAAEPNQKNTSGCCTDHPGGRSCSLDAVRQWQY
ncbi:putative ras-related protein Rab6 [Paratrimastix pyriformis]|uniref:Ras-related protein Rab6 n=1 Tax=Paratrimastix pyriformis TaxID=342808 RepID=A0ABQ8UD52_9EUKA|nr:putative ras-related protein Rab6 [Paratrimastix pyriformis]